MSKTIFVSAGHSNLDPGAVANGYREADIVCELRDLVAGCLALAGAAALTDGIGDENKPLKEAIKLAQTAGRVRVEFHCNAAGNPVAKGVECLGSVHYKPLAQALCATVANIMQIPTRGGDGGWKSENSGQHHRLAFISQGHGLILELFFISNPTEVKKYQALKAALAAGIASVLLEFNE